MWGGASCGEALEEEAEAGPPVSLDVEGGGAGVLELDGEAGSDDGGADGGEDGGAEGAALGAGASGGAEERRRAATATSTMPVMAAATTPPIHQRRQGIDGGRGPASGRRSATWGRCRPGATGGRRRQAGGRWRR
ncbi:MAG: hypothetical protein R3B70_24030 [Polyangiaceae bacterium]